MSILRALGILLIVGFIAWVIAGIVVPFGVHPAPEVLGLGSAFEGNLQLPAETIKNAFEAARRNMLDINGWGHFLRVAGDIAAWLSFLATAVITLILGFLGRTVPARGDLPDLPSRMRPRVLCPRLELAGVLIDNL